MLNSILKEIENNEDHKEEEDEQISEFFECLNLFCTELQIEKLLPEKPQRRNGSAKVMQKWKEGFKRLSTIQNTMSSYSAKKEAVGLNKDYYFDNSEIESKINTIHRVNILLTIASRYEVACNLVPLFISNNLNLSIF